MLELTIWPVPTFEEAYAALDYDSLLDDMKEVVLESRYKLLTHPVWLDTDVTIINELDGNTLYVPKHELNIEEWDIEQINKWAAEYGLDHVER